ncbi:MAG: oligosaccharide flippase family protein [Cyclobacteriaceae bacterium]
MGIVIRQSFYSSISAYIGVGIGYLNAIILMPLFMTPDEIGLMRAVMSIALLLTTFSSFGTGAAIIRYFPLKGSTQEALNQLFTFGLVVVLCAFSGLALTLHIFSEEFFRFFEDKSPEVGGYLILIIILVLQMTFFNLLEITVRSQKEIIIPNMIRDLAYKILHTLIIFLYGFGQLNMQEYLFGMVVIYLILIGLLTCFTFIRYKIRLDFKLLTNHTEFHTLINFSSVGILTSLGYILMVQIDQVMITKYLGLTENGIYTTAIFMVIAVEVPHRFVSQISTTLVSDNLAIGNLKELEDIYKKASINQFILGAFVFCLILINLDNLYSIMPNGDKFVSGWWVFVVIGCVKLMDMTFSLNGEIIGYSKYYKFNLYALIVLGTGAIVLNWILIPIFGLIGAAIASLIAYFIFNLLKLIFVRLRFGIMPFSNKTVLGLVIVILMVILNFQFTSLSNPYYDVLVRSGVFTSIFILLTYKAALSDLFNSMCDQAHSMIIKYLKL